MKGVCYIDSKGREVLHVPFVFIVINYIRRGPEVILDIKRLKTRLRGLKRSKKSLERGLIGFPEISQKDIDAVIELCSQNKTADARDYCIDVFDDTVNTEYNINSESRRYRTCQ